ncbi:MAG: hypothetical protein ACFFC3_00240 [Candidatus Odinarchaeota archaeon]
MTIDLKEFHYPFIFIILIIGYQISIYFFYRYFQIKDEELGINKFLLAFGLLYGFGFTGIVIRTINSYYIDNSILSNFNLRVSHILIFIATFSFLAVISQKSFRDLINTKITKVVCGFTFIISLFILIINNITFVGILVIVAVFIGGLYMLFFHLKLLKKSSGIIRNKLILLLIGESVIIIMIIIGAEKNPYLFTELQQSIIAIIYNPIVILGQLIVFYAIFGFPIFLEFNWQENLLSFYIINSDKTQVLFHYNFIKNNKKLLEADKDLKGAREYNVIFPEGIIGIEKIISRVTESPENKIEKIKQGENLILLNYGEGDLSFLMYCIFVKKEMISIKYFLKLIGNRFTELYKNVVLDLNAIEGKESQIFLDFNNEIKLLLD